jgi:hypothetical protein
MRVDGYSHHDHQKWDLQVSRKGVGYSCKGLKIGKEGSKRGVDQKSSIHESAVHIYIYVANTTSGSGKTLEKNPRHKVF